MRTYAPYLAALCALILGLALYGRYAAPPPFTGATTVIIERGASLPQVASDLSARGIIRSPTALRYVLRATGGSGHLQPGPYLFDHAENLFVVAYRITAGQWGLPSARITFPEGTTVRDMAEKFDGTLPLMTSADFLAAGKPYEGYLFPDTYVFPPDATASSTVGQMRANFSAKMASLSNDVRASGHSLSDIITLASLVEKEARTTENRKLVAGVLYNRLAQGMALQVDAVFGYIFGRDTYSPSLDDLKVNSPYNTYTHAGLPPGPIDNPGMDSILAALHPTASNYLYYLTDKNGVMHYAATYREHLANIAKYPH